MARFKRASAEDVIHADWWDSGVDSNGVEWSEKVFLKPVLSYELQQKAARKALNPPANVSLEQFQKAGAMEMFQWTDQLLMERTLAEGMILNWSLRYEPNEEQLAKGDPGDLVPFTPAALAELDSADMTYILAEINKRARGVKKEAEAEKPGFQPGVSDTNDNAGEPVSTHDQPEG